ncbi:hypothetical protein NL676_000575 [Syzygium grande]|nr:hypothetical protein NL676_000575 [Syzygium grande]
MVLASLQLTMNISGRDKAYVAAPPFRATTEPFQSVTSALHALHLWDLQHFVVIIKTSSPPSNSKAWRIDPRRKLTRLPKRRCWFVVYSEEDSLDTVLKFNNTWETDWRMGIHDCHNYANVLVKRLTGEKYVLKHSRRCTGWLI